MISRKFSDCSHCGGGVVERLLPTEITWEGQSFIFEDVPMGVCNRCGEKVMPPHVAETIDRILQGKEKRTRTAQVPVYQYKTEVSE